jgi:hypothetical protein
LSTWTYSGNPGSSPKDQVRFLIGDTDSKDQLLLDGEITWLLSQANNSPYGAAIRGCEQIMAKFSRMADETVGRVSISFSQKAKGYATLIGQLRQRQAIDDCMPYAGGLSVTDKEARAADRDATQPAFTREITSYQKLTPPDDDHDGRP